MTWINQPQLYPVSGPAPLVLNVVLPNYKEIYSKLHRNPAYATNSFFNQYSSVFEIIRGGEGGKEKTNKNTHKPIYTE